MGGLGLQGGDVIAATKERRAKNDVVSGLGAWRPRGQQRIKLDERNHVEGPLLDQLADLCWEVIDLTDKNQTPAGTYRESFTEVVMPPVLREQLKVINPWLDRRSG